jgi:hypothetical protein
MRLIRADQLKECPVDARVLERATAKAAASARVAIAGIVMELRSDNAALCDAFAKRYRAHATTEPADFLYYVVRDGVRYRFWSAHSPVWEWQSGVLPTDALLFLTEAVGISALVRYDPTLSSVHGAAIRFKGVTAAIVGNASSGKSTTLLACARNGMQVYSDERVLTRGGIVYPYLRTCSVRADAAKRLFDDATHDALRAWLADRGLSRRELSLDEVFGAQAIAPPSPLRVVFVINGYAASPRIQELEPANALPAVTRWLDARGDALDRMGRGLRLLRGVTCYRIALGMPGASVAAIRETVESLSAS